MNFEISVESFQHRLKAWLNFPAKKARSEEALTVAVNVIRSFSPDIVKGISLYHHPSPWEGMKDST